jgi:hypothetical protein
MNGRMERGTSGVSALQQDSSVQIWPESFTPPVGDHVARIKIFRPDTTLA